MPAQRHRLADIDHELERNFLNLSELYVLSLGLYICKFALELRGDAWTTGNPVRFTSYLV